MHHIGECILCYKGTHAALGTSRQGAKFIKHGLCVFGAILYEADVIDMTRLSSHHIDLKCLLIMSITVRVA